MDNDYIYREDAIRLAEQGQVQGFPWQFQMLVRLPPADVVPVVHGKWIPQDHNKRIGCATTAVFYYPKCSACGHNGNYDMYYCPNCGAKMDAQHECNEES